MTNQKRVFGARVTTKGKFKQTA